MEVQSPSSLLFGGPVEPRAALARAVQYPITLEVRYKIPSRRPLAGTGKTLRMSSSNVVFTAEHQIGAGTNLEIAIAWPAALDDRVLLQLVVTGEVVRREGSVLTAAIRKYRFRTRGPWDSNASVRIGSIRPEAPRTHALDIPRTVAATTVCDRPVRTEIAPRERGVGSTKPEPPAALAATASP